MCEVWLPKDYVFWLSSLYQRATPLPYSQLSLKLHPKIFLRKHACNLDKLQKVSSTKYANYGIWGAYLGAPNMVKRGVPEKIVQNAVLRVDFASMGPPSQKLRPNQIFDWFPHCNYNIKLEMVVKMSFLGLIMLILVPLIYSFLCRWIDHNFWFPLYLTYIYTLCRSTFLNDQAYTAW